MRVGRVATSARRSCRRIAKASSIGVPVRGEAAPELARDASRSQIASVTRLDRREVGEQRVDLEGARQAVAHARGRRRAGDVLAVRAGCGRSPGCSWPVIRLISVVLPAPFGPISAWRAPRGSAIEMSRATCSEPKLFCSASVRRTSSSAPHQARLPARRDEAAENAVRHDENDDHQQEPDPEIPVLRVHVGELVARQQEDDRADDAAVEPAGAAEDQHDDDVGGALEAQRVERHGVGGLREQRAGDAGHRGRDRVDLLQVRAVVGADRRHARGRSRGCRAAPGRRTN